MTEKRYSAQKYIQCTCEKHQDILVGMKLYKYFNFIAVPIATLLAVMFLLTPDPLTIGLGIVFVAAIVLLPYSIYKGFKKDMLASGHTQDCSKRTARLGTMYFGIWSTFKIMQGKE